jgi:hypothetical protein
MPGTYSKLKQLRDSHGDLAHSRFRGVKSMRRKVKRHLQQVAVEERQQDRDDKTAAGNNPYQYEGEGERERRLWLEKLPTKQPLRLPPPPVALSSGLMYIPKQGGCDLEYAEPRDLMDLRRENNGPPLPGSIPQRLPPFLVNEDDSTTRRNHLLMHGSSPMLPAFVRTSSHHTVTEIVVDSSSAALTADARSTTSSAPHMARRPTRLNDNLSVGNVEQDEESLRQQARALVGQA